MSAHDGEVESFAGKWWQFPPLRNALLAALVAGGCFAAESLVGLSTEHREPDLHCRDRSWRLSLDS